MLVLETFISSKNKESKLSLISEYCKSFPKG